MPRGSSHDERFSCYIVAQVVWPLAIQVANVPALEKGAVRSEPRSAQLLRGPTHLEHNVVIYPKPCAQTHLRGGHDMDESALRHRFELLEWTPRRKR